MDTTKLWLTVKSLTNSNRFGHVVYVSPCDFAFHFITNVLRNHRRNEKKFYCITANFDDSSKNGSHWLAFLIDTQSQSAELFDSLAIHDLYPNYMRQIISILKDHNFRFKSNFNQRFQSMFTNCCGHYCALFFHHRLVQGINFDSFCHLLNCQFRTFCARDCAVFETVYKLSENQVSSYIPNNPSEECTCIQICKQGYHLIK